MIILTIHLKDHIMKKIIFGLTIIFATTTVAQQLQTPSFAYSHKKKAYLTLTNGTDIIGNIDKVKRKKGLIKEIRVTDGSGTKLKLKPSDISFMYLPPSGLDNIGRAVSMTLTVQKWNQTKLNEDLLNQGLIYLEQAPTKVKKKTMLLLVQLLNPSFSAKVKVYHDPRAKTTAGVGIGPLKVTGGIAKSYYIKKEGDQAAYKFDKHGYKKEFSYFWNCEKMNEFIDDEKAWRNLAKHVAKYTTDCE